MSKGVQKIRRSRIQDDLRIIHWLPLHHPAATVLRAMGVTIAGTDTRSGPETWGEGITDTTLLFFVEKGRVISLGNPDSPEVMERECLIVPAGCVKRLRIGDEILRASWFHLQDTDQWKHLLGPVRTFRALEQISLLWALMENLLQETLSQRVPTPLAESMAETMAEWLLRNFGTPESGRNRETKQRLQELWKLVSQDLSSDWTAARLAANLHVSVGHLHRIVKEFHHDHPMKIVTRMRLQKAAGFLLSTSDKLETIAAATGYKTAFALSNAFLREMGVRPGEYREKSKNLTDSTAPGGRRRLSRD